MSVKYSRTFCENFVFCLEHDFSYRELLELWTAMVFSDVRPAPPFIVAMPEWVIWREASPWNKQGILFLLAPIIERMPGQFALKFSSIARKTDPL